MKLAAAIVWILAALMTAQFVAMIRSYVRNGRGITQQTVNTAMLFALATLAVPALAVSPLHLLWLFPVSWILGSSSIVFPFSLLSLPGHYFGMLCCVRLSTIPQETGSDLIDAAAAGELTRVRALLDAKADVDAKADNGITALIMASQMGYPEIVGALLDAKADVNTKADKDFTALILASLRGHVEVVRTLLAANADVNDQPPEACSRRTRAS